VYPQDPCNKFDLDGHHHTGRLDAEHPVCKKAYSTVKWASSEDLVRAGYWAAVKRDGKIERRRLAWVCNLGQCQEWLPCRSLSDRPEVGSQNLRPR
jgi:hypothetical protein